MRLNYHHLFYFWTIAREGSITAASRSLRVSHPTLSAQLRLLESQLGGVLFDRVGKRLVLSEAGRVAFRYADEIFALGSDLTETLAGRQVGKPNRIVVGVADVVPKLVTRELLLPLLASKDAPRLVCIESTFDRLLADLATYAVDVVIADSPIPPGSNIRATCELLGETSVSLFGAKQFRRLSKGFPSSLDRAPFILPLEISALRRELNHWFALAHIAPKITGEFGDSVLLKLFGARGLGIFPSPSSMAAEVCSQFGVFELGKIPDVTERYYALTMPQKLTNPLINQLIAEAKAFFANRVN